VSNRVRPRLASPIETALALHEPGMAALATILKNAVAPHSSDLSIGFL
jgi:hypothetical protein